MPYLTPAEIFNAYKNKELDMSTTMRNLIAFIENSAQEQERVEAIEVLGKMGLKAENIFKFLEQLSLSDSNEAVRAEAIKIVINNFLDLGVRVVKWLIKNEKSANCLMMAYHTLEAKNNEKSVQLMKEMVNIIGEKYIKDNGLVPREAMVMGLLEMMSDVEVIDERTYYEMVEDHCSFYVRDGFVSSLNLIGIDCEIFDLLYLLPHLQWLDLDVNAKEINNVEKLIELRYLYLRAPLLKPVDLSALVNLSELVVVWTPLSMVKGIESLSSLVSISFEDTEISESEEKKYRELIKNNKERLKKKKEEIIHLGKENQAQGNSNKTIEAYEQAIQVSSKIRWPDKRIFKFLTCDEWFNLAKLYLKKNEYEKALNACEQGIKVDSRPKAIRDLYKLILQLINH